MKGKYDVTVTGHSLHYSFTINRNITIIKGDSATGKTRLVSMIQRFNRLGNKSGVLVMCKRPCVVIESSPSWADDITKVDDSIVFLDEECTFVATHEFASIVRESSNYFVIITRMNLSSLPYSIREVYELRKSNRYVGLRMTYNEFHNLYPDGE